MSRYYNRELCRVSREFDVESFDDGLCRNWDTSGEDPDAMHRPGKNGLLEAVRSDRVKGPWINRSQQYCRPGPRQGTVHESVVSRLAEGS
jgi:hypothetical protein